MKTSNILSFFTILMLSLMVSSCSAIAGIFKAGMGVGIFIVVLVIIVIVAIIMWAGKSKS